MPRLREQALQIWTAGVDVVRAENLITRYVNLTGTSLRLGTATYDLAQTQRIAIVGAGKAAGYLAASLEKKLAPCSHRIAIEGWVNVPANCVVPTAHVTLHPARPAGVNEPRQAGVDGTQHILQLVSTLRPTDICICLLTGGASALLPAPLPSISLEDKLLVTRVLSQRGASIQDLNRVRTGLSMVKGGGLARACKANRMTTLIISDVLGDPLDLIGSGPTVPSETQPGDAEEILRRYAQDHEIPIAVWEALRLPRTCHTADTTCQVDNQILANNGHAVSAAATMARQLCFEPHVWEPESPETTAESVAGRLLDFLHDSPSGPVCVIWGGEPVVHLTSGEQLGRGGRNQQLALAAFSTIAERYSEAEQCCLLSGGTDGEDGPTDAAGAFVDNEVVKQAHNAKLDAADYLARHDAYSFFAAAGGLIKTGPTHTNVCDLRILVRA